jgi:hypothetical protein
MMVAPAASHTMNVSIDIFVVIVTNVLSHQLAASAAVAVLVVFSHSIFSSVIVCLLQHIIFCHYWAARLCSRHVLLPLLPPLLMLLKCTILLCDPTPPHHHPRQPSSYTTPTHQPAHPYNLKRKQTWRSKKYEGNKTEKSDSGEQQKKSTQK